MRWKGRRQSDNVDDRRGQRSGYGLSGASSSMLNFLPMLIRSKIGRTILIVGIVIFFGAKMMGIDLLPMLLGGGSPTTASSPKELSPQDQEASQFAAFVLADTEDTWKVKFQKQGQTYKEPTMVLFNNRVNSACGMAPSASGPFYCPADQQLYLDLSFFNDLKTQHGASGDFAQAYVIAHEVGHHVQTLLGISNQVRQAGRGKSAAQVNALSVRQELQADCLAGLWGNAANTERQLLHPGDLEEALTAASAIGDDRLMREAGRGVVPDSFTHGTSAQRVKWFKRGFTSGDFNSCDTFKTDSL